LTYLMILRIEEDNLKHGSINSALILASLIDWEVLGIRKMNIGNNFK